MDQLQFARVGERFQMGGIAYRIEKYFRDDQTLEIYNLGLKRRSTMAMEELVSLWNEGKLCFEIVGRNAKGEGDGGEDAYVSRIVDFSTLPEDKRLLAKKWYEWIHPLLAMAPSTRSKAFLKSYCESLFQNMVNQVAPDEKERLIQLRESGRRLPAEFLVTPRKLQQLMTHFNASGGDIRSLVDRSDERGGKRGHRLNAHLEALIQQVIDDYYLQPPKPNDDSAWKKIQEQFKKENMYWPESDRVLPSRATVYRRIWAIDPMLKLERRYGKTVVNNFGGRLVGKGMAPLMPMERVAIDHYIPKLIVLDDDLRIPIGPGTISAEICESTRVMPGISFGWDPPSYLGVMDCLYQGIRPKLDVKEKFGTQHDYIGYGLPGTLITDNGKEFKGISLEDAALQLKFGLEHNQAFSPFLKGKIERWFHTLFDDVIINIPGTVFGHIFDGDGYDAKNYACVTLSAFKQILTKYIVDEYHYQPHRGLHGKTPAEAWEAGIQKGWWPALPPNLDELHVLLGRKFRRTIQHYGIDFENIRYQNTQSEALANLRKRLMQKSEGTDRLVTLKVDPNNLGSVYVYDAIETRSYIQLQAIDAPEEYDPEGLSLWAHRAIVKFRNAVNADKNQRNQISLNQARGQLNQIVESEFAKTSSLRKKSHNKRFLAGSKPDVAATSHPYTDLLPPPPGDWLESAVGEPVEPPQPPQPVGAYAEPEVWEVKS